LQEGLLRASVETPLSVKASDGKREVCLAIKKAGLAPGLSFPMDARVRPGHD